MRMINIPLIPLVAMLALSMTAPAKDKKVKAPPKDPQDAIEVLGHIRLANGPVSRFVSTQHYSSYYLYVEYISSKSVTIIDVTKTAHPAVLADVSYPSDGGGTTLVAVAGTAALVTEERGPAASASSPQTIRIMDFSDPEHPKVAREFDDVTALSRDEQRGLIFLANPEGLWILHQSFALDPEVEKAYAHYVLYSH